MILRQVQKLSDSASPLDPARSPRPDIARWWACEWTFGIAGSRIAARSPSR